MQGIEIEVSHAGQNNGLVVISPRGYIDTTTSPQMEKIIHQQTAAGNYRIIVNLEGVNYISSTGWGVFVGELKGIRSNAGDLVLTNMSPNIHDIFELMEFSSILKGFGSIKEAMVYFLGKPGKRGTGQEKGGTAAQKGSTGAFSAAGGSAAGAAAAPGGAGAGSFSAAGSAGEHTSSAEDNHNPEDPVPEYFLNTCKSEVLNVFRYTLERNVLRVVSEKPYLSIKEITRALKLARYGGRKQRKRKVKKVLKEMGLLKLKERVEYALENRPPPGTTGW
ncbi:MAG: STAS domain-containing protein [Spirochaetota bacterium]